MTKNEKKINIAAGVAVVISLAQLFIPKIFPICQNMIMTASGGMNPMRCHYTYQAEFLVALSSLFVAVALYFVHGAEGRRLIGGFLSLLGAITLLLPQSWFIGICANPNEPCQVTYWWTVAGGFLLVIAGGIIVWLASRPAPHQNEQ